MLATPKKLRSSASVLMALSSALLFAPTLSQRLLNSANSLPTVNPNPESLKPAVILQNFDILLAIE